MNDTPTPETDEAAGDLTGINLSAAFETKCRQLEIEKNRLTDFARDIERQLAERDEQLAYVKGLLNTSEGSRRILGDLLSDEKARLAEATAWRPIDSAPKDGTHILAALKWREEYTQTVIYWTANCWQLAETGGNATDGDPDGTPTHWQPLPNPPTDSNP